MDGWPARAIPAFVVLAICALLPAAIAAQDGSPDSTARAARDQQSRDSLAQIRSARDGASRAGSADILEFYRSRRMHGHAAEMARRRLPVYDPVPVTHDTLVAALRYVPQPPGEVAPVVDIYHLRRIPKFARPWFDSTFADVAWAFDGGNALARIDTMFTREIRARMEHAFGPPTVTLGDEGPLHRLRQDEYVQFEYWFVVNTETPVKIMDVNGPFERGVVVSGPADARQMLIALRDAVLAPILASEARAPYADYFFEAELETWFVTGYDGQSYYMEPVNPRTVNAGRPSPARPREGAAGGSGADAPDGG